MAESQWYSSAQMPLYPFTLLPILVQAFTAVKMHRRKQHVLYPAFWAYLWFESIRLTIELILRFASWSRAFFYVYWGAGFISALFMLVVLREIFSRILADYTQLTRFQRRGYEVALAVVSFLAVLFSAQLRGRIFFTREIIQIQQAVGIVGITMLVFVAGASIALGIRWRSELCGIASGMGLLSIGDVVVFTITLLRSTYDPRLIGWVESIVYDAAFVIMAAYFIVPQEQRTQPIIKNELEWAHQMSESLQR